VVADNLLRTAHTTRRERSAVIPSRLLRTGDTLELVVKIKDRLFRLRLDRDRSGLVTASTGLQEGQQVDGTDNSQDGHDGTTVGFIEIELEHLYFTDIFL